MSGSKLKIENKYFIAPNKIFEIGLKPNEISIYMYLLRCGNNSTAFPSYNTIANKTGMSRDTAIRVVKKLIDIELIIKTTRTKTIITKKLNNEITLHDSNIYEVVVDLEAYKNTRGSSREILGVVAENDQGSSREILGVVAENDQGSSREILGVVAENDPINNYLINNYEKELIDKELSKNISTLQQKNDSEKDSNFDSKESKKKEKQVNIFNVDSQEIKASKYLFEKILENDPNAKVPDFQKWALHIDYLTRLDKRNLNEIKSVIDFCQSDNFWKGNILSTKKLREKFTTLFIKMNDGNKSRSQYKKHMNFLDELINEDIENGVKI
jgi:hypothetical protein